MVKPSDTTILVYESGWKTDEPVSEHLEKHGYHVLKAHSRMEAVNKIRDRVADLVMIAGDHGAEEARVVTAVVKAFDRDMLVAMASTATLEFDDVLATGVDLFVQLPCEPKDLLDQLAALLDSPYRLQ